MRFSSLSWLALAAALPNGALAQSTVSLNEVVIAGGLAPIEQAEYGRAYSIITAEEIEKRGLQTVPDAIRALPGISLNAPTANMSQVRIRGGEGNHTLVLIDGVRMPTERDEYVFAGLSTTDIERIEVLRGPQAVSFGNNASSGVINIITKKAVGNGYGGKVELGRGHLAQIYAQSRSDRGGLRLSLSDLNDRGHDFSGQNGEKDFTKRRTLQLSGDWQATERLTFSAQVYHARDHFAFDEADYVNGNTHHTYLLDRAGDEIYRRESLGSLSAQYGEESDRVTHFFEVSRVDYKTQTKGFAWDRTRNDALKYRATIGLDGTVGTAAHRLFVMAEHQQDRNSGRADFSRRQNSVAAEYRGEVAEGFNLQAGLRRDQNDRYEDFTGWSLAASYQLDPNLRLHASAGRASVKPGFSEIFGNAAWSLLPNPDLTPEVNRSLDLGVELAFAEGRGLLDVTLFKERLGNEISSVMIPDPGGDPSLTQWVNRNIGGTGLRKGAEISARYDLNQTWSFGANYTYLDAKQGNGQVSLRRPRHELGLTASWRSQDQRLTLSGDYRLQSGNMDAQYFNAAAGYPVVALPTARIVTIAANYRLSDTVALSGRVQNLFDKKTSDAWGYHNQGRTAWIGLSADF